MAIEILCVCGKRVVINEEMAGQDINCIRCGRPVQLPKPKPPAPVPEEAPAAAVQPGSASEGSLREYLYWVIALALFPLAVYLSRPETATFSEQLEKTLNSCSSDVQQTARKIWQNVEEGEGRLDDLFDVLPNHRLDGAAVSRRSAVHLLLALGSAAVFWTILSFCFSPGSAKPGELVLVGLFTGVIGIGFLEILQHWGPTSAFIQLCFLADDEHRPDLFKTWAVYTLGVGLFEEGVKLVPLIWYLVKHRRISWRLACLWGLASGTGFGISEAITYSGEMYNGIVGPQVYLVRFVSCIGLHAIWTASAGISLSYCQDVIREMLRWDIADVQASIQFTADRPLYTLQDHGQQDYLGWAVVGLKVLLVVMFLHGMYDAALTRQYYIVALAVAVASFAWLAWQIETARLAEKGPEPLGSDPQPAP